MPDKPRIFISYARRDGADLAQRIQQDLQAAGFDAWLDVQRLRGGASWSIELERALAGADVVLAILTDGSYASDPCRAEHGVALDRGKRVIPVVGQADCPIPLHLCNLQRIDLSHPGRYDAGFAKILRALGDRRAFGPPSVPKPRYNNAESLPENFVERPELLARLRDALFLDSPKRNIALTALRGMGGIGKTVLAQALCQDAAVRAAFPDGIFWFTLGREPRSFPDRIKSVPGLHELLGGPEGDIECRSRFRAVMRKRSVLVVLDDVWDAAAIRPFHTNSRFLLTTRNADLGPAFDARPFTAELLADCEARKLLAAWADLPEDQLPVAAGGIVAQCGNLPLALALIGAHLRGKPPAFWPVVLGQLRDGDWSKVRSQFPEPHTSVFVALEVSFQALRKADPVAAERYLALAVLLEDMPAHPLVQRALWGCDADESLETAERLIALSLAARDGDAGAISLHDVQFDYVCAQFSDQAALKLIHGAARLSAHVIDLAPEEFAGQLIGRLLPYVDIRAIAQFCSRLAQGALKPWLQPRQPALSPPRTGLLHTLSEHTDDVRSAAITADGLRAESAYGDYTLEVRDLTPGTTPRFPEGHTSLVNAVAVTSDGLRAVSASHDHTLRVWDLSSGAILRTLENHPQPVRSVAVTADGLRAVSASSDNTLRVWDLFSGATLRTLEGHTSIVESVAVTAEGLRAVSASWDHTLRVWDLSIGATLRILEGHTNWVRSVAVTADGLRAVSASSDHTLRVWDLSSGATLRTLEGHAARVNAVAVTADGLRAVSASDDMALRVWDLASGAAVRTLEGHTSGVTAVGVTADGLRAVSASGDTTLRVWDLATGATLAIFHADHPVLSCAWAGAGRVLAGDAGGHVHRLTLEE